MENVLHNLSSGPPADPLQQLGANKPSAGEMADYPRQHPYLFFDSSSRLELRARTNTEPYRSLLERIRGHADQCLSLPLPATARVIDGIKQLLPDGSYNPEYLKNNYDDLYKQSSTVLDVIPALGFAWQVTGDQRYGAAGKRWLLNFASRPQLARIDRATDFDAANMMTGLALGYDWLAELLDADEKQQVKLALSGLARPIFAAGKKILADSRPELSRGILGGNHATTTHSLFGLTALALLYELPEAQQWLDMEIQLQRDRLLPSMWAPDGEYIDGWDHFSAGLDAPVPFLVALKRLGGEDLFNNRNLRPRFRGISNYWLYGLEMRCRSNLGASDLYGWYALAGQLRDPIAQWIVTRASNLKTVDPIWAFLFFDPTVEAVPPKDPDGGSVYWPYSGMVKLATGWTSIKDVLISFRCGPEIGKDYGDQNGFRLYAGREWIVPRLADADRLQSEPLEFNWDLYAWFRGSPAQDVIVLDPDDIADFSTFSSTGRIELNGGIQYAEYPPMKGREYAKQWLSGPAIPKRGELRTVHFDRALDYVCGEAHRAYTSIVPSLWVRHILLAKGDADGRQPYAVICDEAEADEPARTFAWQIHARRPMKLVGQSLYILGQNTTLGVQFMAPADDLLVEKKTPAPLESQRSEFIQWQTNGPKNRCFFLTVLLPQPSGSKTQPPSFHLIQALGGWAISVQSSLGEDLVLFRSERAKLVRAGGVVTTSSAALFRKTPSAPDMLYILGKN